jgi:Protein of unknown function with HXXEE motif
VAGLQTGAFRHPITPHPGKHTHPQIVILSEAKDLNRSSLRVLPIIPHFSQSQLQFRRQDPAKSGLAKREEPLPMSHLQALLCLCVGAYGMHVLEEFVFDWRNWAIHVLHLPAHWDDFYITNALVVVVGSVAVAIAPTWPAVALGFPALMLINGFFMHVVPFLRTRGRFSPGLITSVLLFFPIGIATMRAVPLNAADLAIAFLVGAALLATPIGFVVLRQRPYFDQTR